MPTVGFKYQSDETEGDEVAKDVKGEQEQVLDHKSIKPEGGLH